MNPEPEPEQLYLPERRQGPEPARARPIATPLYDSDRPRHGRVRCGVCQRENHETRLWCIRCGHQLGVPLTGCV